MEEKSLLPFRKPWARCVGSDRLSTMLRAEYWERFRQVQPVMGYSFIRCHGLLGDELGVVRSDLWEGQARRFYNFTYLDQIFDTMAEHRVRPFVEWSFMPRALASGSDTVFWWEGNITPPSVADHWAELVTTLTRHWVDRYGLDEVRRWPFEVWNEPNLGQFWKDADQNAYFGLYETTARAVKAVDAQIRVGGPAICGGSDHWIEAFLNFVDDRSVPLDFFSRHLYTGQTPRLRTPEFLYQSLSSPDSPVKELHDVRRRIDAAGHPELELHITEFNTSYHPLCPVHDTPLNAAYLARLLSEAGDLVETLSYWTFADLFEEADVPRSLFHGGFGLVAGHGIPKPTFHLFAFFARLGDRVVHRDDHVLVTRKADATLAVVAWNPVLDPRPDPRRVSVTVPWSGGPALVRRSRVHETAANPWGLWCQLGRPRFPDAATVAFLQDAARPQVETAVLEPVLGDRAPGLVLVLSFSLQTNEVTLLEVQPFHDESPSYLGLDDGLIDGYSTNTKRQGGLS